MVQTGEKLRLLHRSRVDIIANILRVAMGGAKKTHIMYRCNLSFKQVQIYLDFLVNRGLLKTVIKSEENGGSNFFETTSKGRAFLHAYRSLRAVLLS